MIHLPSSVAVAPDALGMSVSAKVGDLELGIHFPIAGPVNTLIVFSKLVAVWLTCTTAVGNG